MPPNAGPARRPLAGSLEEPSSPTSSMDPDERLEPIALAPGEVDQLRRTCD